MSNTPNNPGMRSPQFFQFSPLICGAFILSFIYWGYLLFASRMVIVYDGMVYEQLGQMIYYSGWIEFFKTGPHNEPFFPFLISISMRVADFFAVPYQSIQASLHMLLLFLTQLLTLFVLHQVNTPAGIKALVVLYMGISPILVNATFSLWSEIAALPFILLITLASVQSWGLILNNEYKKIVLGGICLALAFVMTVSIKALFEYIFIALMMPYFVLLIRSVIKRERRIFIGALLFLVTALALFNSYLFFYKSLSRKYNGHFMMADRGPWIFYGNALRRSESLTLKRFMAYLAFVAGDNACYKLFDKNECDFWSFFTINNYGLSKLEELENSGIPNEEIDSVMLTLAKEKIWGNPFQQVLLIFIEGFKMLFWESTRIGYVSYPPWLQGIFEFTPFKDGLRLSLSLITLLSILYTLGYLFRNRDRLLGCRNREDRETHVLFFILVLVVSYIGFYSLFNISTRFASLMASLYLIMIAFTIRKTMVKNQQKMIGCHEN